MQRQFQSCYYSGLLVLFLLVASSPTAAQTTSTVRLKELVFVEGAQPLQLTGYGLVVGLDRTGDRARGQRNSPYTVQSIANMLRRFGITVDPATLSSRNAAAVMVTTTLGPFHQAGSRLDVTVSSLGDARSISGGVLLQTPLLNPTSQEVYAIAQGAISTGAASASSFGSQVQVNYTNTGRVPNGALVKQALATTLSDQQELGLMLRNPDFTNASRIAEAVNNDYPDAATVEHAGAIRVQIPPNVNNVPSFIGQLEATTVQVDAPARVVINERTGTIVAGGNIKISQVMVTSGNLVIATQANPEVSQPPPFSEGETVPYVQGTASVEEEQAESVVLPPNTDVNQLATTLNDLGLPSRDIIAIFQAIDGAGALQGQLIIQ